MPAEAEAAFEAQRAASGDVFRPRVPDAPARALHALPAGRRRGHAVDAREYHASAENAPDDLRSEYVVDGELQLSQWARDAIATMLPTQILCRQDCAGLCPVCGKDLNDEPHGHEETVADPRWAALEALREE